MLDAPPPDVDVVIAGDVCYEESMAGRMVAWLQAAADRGITVLLGDPGRAYAPRNLVRLATYRVAKLGGVLLVAVGVLLVTGTWDQLTGLLRQWASSFQTVI